MQQKAATATAGPNAVAWAPTCTSQAATPEAAVAASVATNSGQARSRGTSTVKGAQARTVRPVDRFDQAPWGVRLKTRLPFVPPKPKLFFSAKSIFISRALLAQ